MVVDENRSLLISAITAVLHDGDERSVRIRVEAGGMGRQCAVAFRPLRDQAGAVTGAVAAVTDVTAEARLQDSLRRQAALDPLTGCLNRTAAMRSLRDAIPAASTGVGLVVVDLDDFRAVNEQLGHSAGDRLLCNVVGRIRAETRATDVVARIGGDEFLVICSEVDPTALRAVAERIGLALRATRADASVHVQGSIGVAWTSDAAADADELLRRADAATQRSKRARRGEPVVADPYSVGA